MAETNLIDNLSEPALPIDHCDTFIELEEYHLDENTPEPVSKPEPVRTAPKTRKSRSWHLVRIYDDGPQAKEWLTQNPDWSLQKMYDTEAGMKKVFRCNLVRRRGPQCEKVIQFQYNSHNMAVLHFETTCDHTHNEILKHYKKPGINQVTKEAIKKQLDLGITKPKTIRNNLAEEQLANPGIEVPTDSQLFNFLQVLKRLNRNIDFNLNQCFNDDYLSFLPEIILFEEDQVSMPEVLGEGPRGRPADANKPTDPVQVQAAETDSVQSVATTAPVNRPATGDECQPGQVPVQLSATESTAVTAKTSLKTPTSTAVTAAALKNIRVTTTSTALVNRPAPDDDCQQAQVSAKSPANTAVTTTATPTAVAKRLSAGDECQPDQGPVQLSATATETVTTAASVNRPATSTENATVTVASVNRPTTSSENATVNTTGSVNRTASAQTATVTATTSMKRPAPTDNVLPAKRRRGRPPKNQ